MTTKEIYEKIMTWGIDQFVKANNEITSEYGESDYHIYRMDEFDEVMKDYAPSEILEMTKDDFSLDDTYFWFKDYVCELASASSVDQIPDGYLDGMAQFLADCDLTYQFYILNLAIYK